MGSVGESWRELDVAVIGGGIGASNRKPELPNSTVLTPTFFQGDLQQQLLCEGQVIKSQSMNEPILQVRLVPRSAVQRMEHDGLRNGVSIFP
jgi:hypothetical protein